MKKLIYLFLLSLLIQVPAFSQTAIIDEDFTEPLSDWELEGNWGQEDGYLMLYYYPIFEDYDFSSYTPVFEIPPNGGDVLLSLFLDVYLSNATDEKCEISVLYGDQEEDVLWSHNLTDGPWGDYSGSDLTLSLDDYSGETVQLRMRSYGSSTNALWGWFVFNINLTTWFDHELCAMEILGPTNLNIMESGTWEIEVKNQGLNSENDFFVNLYSAKDEQILASEPFDGNLLPGETGTIEIEWSSNFAHNTVLYATVQSQSDQFENNNRSHSRFLRIEPDLEYNILFWDNDNGIASVENPETGIFQEPHQGIQKAFQVTGINIDLVSSLPDNLEEYTIVISTMGCYCLS
jgi:hypothetical protein